MCPIHRGLPPGLVLVVNKPITGPLLPIMRLEIKSSNHLVVCVLQSMWKGTRAGAHVAALAITSPARAAGTFKATTEAAHEVS